MDKQKREMLTRAATMMAELDDKSLFLTISQMNVLLARQEMEKGVSDNVAQGNSDIRER